MNRRDFLRASAAALILPAYVRAESLMPVVALPPRTTTIWWDGCSEIRLEGYSDSNPYTYIVRFFAQYSDVGEREISQIIQPTNRGGRIVMPDP